MSNQHIPAECPRCHLALRLRREYLGRWVSCRYCGQVFQALDEPPPDTEAVAVGTGLGNPVSPDAGNDEPAHRDPRAGHSLDTWSFGRESADLTRAAPRSGSDVAPEHAADRHRVRGDRPRWDRDRPATVDEPDGPRRTAGSPADTGDTPCNGQGLREREPAEQRDALARSHDALVAEHRAQSARLEDALTEVAALRREVDALKAERREAEARSLPPPQLPVLCRDLARWSLPATRTHVTVTVAVPVGPPPLPPSLDDLDVVEQQIAMLRRLVRLTPERGKGFHTLFDLPRFLMIQSKLKEAGILADRLLTQFERSKEKKDLLWHLMLAQRSDEINRRRR